MVTMGAMRVEAQKAAMRSDVIRQGREEVLYCELIVERGALERRSGNLVVKLESGVMKAAKRELSGLKGGGRRRMQDPSQRSVSLLCVRFSIVYSILTQDGKFRPMSQISLTPVLVWP